jgi:hypothetical protein
LFFCSERKRIGCRYFIACRILCKFFIEDEVIGGVFGPVINEGNFFIAGICGKAIIGKGLMLFVREYSLCTVEIFKRGGKPEFKLV